jgi:hypothetical protein
MRFTVRQSQRGGHVNNPSNEFCLEVLRRLLVESMELRSTHAVATVELDRGAGDERDGDGCGGSRGVKSMFGRHGGDLQER